ncbi:MAG: hypothetical protein ABI700_27500, partial [Chloroflexota bacterium]
VSIYNLLTMLTASPLKPQHELICAVYAGESSKIAQSPSIERADWEGDGTFVAQVDGQVISVQPVESSGM